LCFDQRGSAPTERICDDWNPIWPAPFDLPSGFSDNRWVGEFTPSLDEPFGDPQEPITLSLVFGIIDESCEEKCRATQATASARTTYEDFEPFQFFDLCPPCRQR
jgi:hypothetical protein